MRKMILPDMLQREHSPADILIVYFWPPRIIRKSILVVLSQLVYGVSFWQPQEANILLIYTTQKRFREEMVEVDLQPALSTLY